MHNHRIFFVFLALIAFSKALAGQTQPAAPAQPEAEQRTRLNLLGQTNVLNGESRRNENVQFNLVDNNLLKELNNRLGTTATIITEFRPELGYYGAEYGNAPKGTLHILPQSKPGIHGRLFLTHLNSVFSSRSFFQVGNVKPARENHYGAELGASVGKTYFSFNGDQQKVRGMVNGNVLVPLASERTPLATDPALAAYVSRILASFPAELPNRTDINPRMLNTNSPQRINSDTGAARLERDLSLRDRILLRHQLVIQKVVAFQFIKGMNPDTTTRSHASRLTWIHRQNANTIFNVSLGFDRIGSLLVPEKNNLGPRFTVTGLTEFGPALEIPIDRAENMFRHAFHLRLNRGRHAWSAGYELLRRHLNGYQSDSHLGSFNINNDQGRDAITNLRLGLPTKIFVSVGDTHRRFRNWDQTFYVGDTWQATNSLTVNIGLRYQPVMVPSEAGGLTIFPYKSDLNNFGPTAGLAQRLPGRWGLVRASYTLAYDTIAQATYQQLRFNPPLNLKLVIHNPSLLDPVGTYLRQPQESQRKSLYIINPHLVAAYSSQYNFSWQPELGGQWRLQLGYVGSRTPKIIQTWYVNRARNVPGIPLTTATIDERRPDPNLSEVKHILNSSFAWYDAARITLILPRWRGVSIDASYWFSKSIDLGANYSDTASGRSQYRAQWEFDSHHDLKGLSDFDQPHAMLARISYEIPNGKNGPAGLRLLAGGWNLSAVVSLKSGTPFTVESGSDAPGYGNVDGARGDRPNILDPSILGRTIGSPDTSRQLLPRSAFAFIKPGELAGNLGRNVFRKGKISNINAAVSRRIGLSNGHALQLRAESINLTNTPQFAAPGESLSSPDFGTITNTLNEGRVFRFTLGFEF